MSRALPWLLIPLLCSTSACGPTDEEAARAVLFVSPFVFAISIGWLHVLLLLWRKLRPEIGLAHRPVLISGGALVLLAVLSLIGVTNETPTDSLQSTTDGIPGVMEWVGMALFLFGTTFMTLHLFTWRIWLAAAPKSAFGWAHLPALVILLLPAFPMAFGVTWDWDEVIGPLWIFPGYMGLTTLPLLLGLLIECWVRIARKRKRERAGA